MFRTSYSLDELTQFAFDENDRADERLRLGDFEGTRILMESVKDACLAAKLSLTSPR